MYFFARIKAILAYPLAFLMLLTGLSFVPKSTQQEREAELAADIAGEFTPIFRFVIASDVHINANDGKNGDRLAKMFQTAYAYSDAHPSYNTLDAFLLAGDNVDSGSPEEYEILNRVVEENIRPETEMVTVMGNHEFAVTGHDGYKQYMGEELDKHVVIKGFHIIGISPTPTDTWHSPMQMLWMQNELRKAAQDDPEKPIFTMQHGHIWNTVYVSRSWYTQMFLPLHMVYAGFPQVINFSGHSHGPINNPIDIWQNNYTQIGTGTLKYFEMERDIGDNTVPAGSENAAQYLIVEVDKDNRVRVTPFNILTGDVMKTPSNTDDPAAPLVYFIRKPSDPSTFVYTSARKKTATVPQFDDTAALNVTGVTADSVSVTFDQAKDDVCVYGYRISVTDGTNPFKPTAEKEIYSGYYFEPMPETLDCTVAGLAANTDYTVTVTPLNVWLQKGEPLTATFRTTP